MSWALEAIEKAAMERARNEFCVLPGATILGMTIPQIAALRAFFTETIGNDPSQFEADELVRRLRDRRK